MLVYLHLRYKMRPWVVDLARLMGSAAPEAASPACPECGSTKVKYLRRPDSIERFSRAPWSMLHRALGGKLTYCVRCRLQFFDCRKRIAV